MMHNFARRSAIACMAYSRYYAICMVFDLQFGVLFLSYNGFLIYLEDCLK